MFNLVKYRFAFIVLSLLIIVPGVISLAIFHLKVGIDFAGGASVTLRPQQPISSAQVKTLLQPLKLQDAQITTGNLGNSNAQQAGNKTIWIRLNTQVDDNVVNTIKTTLLKQYPGINVAASNVSGYGNSGPFSLLLVTGFQNVPQTSDIKSLLNKLLNTTDTTKSSTPNSTSGPLAPTPTAAAQAKSTPAPTATSSNSNPANIPVNVVDVSQGQTTQTINILTSTDVNSNYVWDKIQPQLLAHNGPYVQLISSSSVSGSVAADTTRNAFLAVVAASLFILLYIWFSFRKVSKPWRYGTCAIIALLHDALVVLGIFSILGALFNIQIDALFITALLTVIGFSVHDTIVVFDRIRENMHRRSTETFEEVVNASLVQTMTRSLNTSLTVLLTLLTLTLFGIGTSIFTFTLALLIGIISGTYSSIFNASMLLVMWEKGETVFGLFNREPERVPVRRSREARELARTR